MYLNNNISYYSLDTVPLPLSKIPAYLPSSGGSSLFLVHWYTFVFFFIVQYVCVWTQKAHVVVSGAIVLRSQRGFGGLNSNQ